MNGWDTAPLVDQIESRNREPVNDDGEKDEPVDNYKMLEGLGAESQNSYLEP